MKNKKKTPEFIFISNERYINSAATDFLKNKQQNIKYYYYDDTQSNYELLINILSENTSIKNVILMVNSTSISNSGILDKFSEKIFIAPYSTFESLRKYSNCYFCHGSDDYLLQSPSILGQIIGSGSKFVTVITSEPTSDSNGEIRLRLNNIVNENLIKRDKRDKFKFKKIEQLTVANFEKEINEDPTLKVPSDRTAITRRIYYIGDGKGAKKLIDIIKTVYQGETKPKFILVAFLNYFNLPISEIIDINKSYPIIQFSVIYAGKSFYGNDLLGGASELGKLLKEEYIDTMTPSTSVIPSILGFENIEELENNGIIYKGNNSNFIRIGPLIKKQ